MSSPRYWAAASRAHGAGHHERRTRGDALAERVVHPDVGRVARAEVVAADDQDAVVGPIAEPLGQSCHESEDTGCSRGRGT